MKALVYYGPGKKDWEEVPDPKLEADTDAIVRVDTTTICGPAHLEGRHPRGDRWADPRP
jgi:threonine dehydrogenase-like Zn-dependent dehydrogenase